MGVEVASRFWGTTIDLIAPANDSDNRSRADSVGNGGRVSFTGGATFWGACAAVVGIAGNEISATSMLRKGCLLSE